MESAVKQRLVQFIKSMHMTQRAFEIRCGMSNGYVANIRKGIGEDYLLNIAQQFPQLNRAWLLFGEGEMLKTSTTFSGDITIGDVRNSNLSHIGHGQQNTVNNNNEDIPYIEVEEVERAPILSATLARSPEVDLAEVLNQKADELEKSPIGVFNAPVSIWYRVQDESLAPKYEIGDLLALWAYPKGEEDPIPGKMYGISTSTNGLIVRRLFPQEDGSYIARAANRDEFPDYRIKPGNVKQVYKIMLMVRF